MLNVIGSLGKHRTQDTHVPTHLSHARARSPGHLAANSRELVARLEPELGAAEMYCGLPGNVQLSLEHAHTPVELRHPS